MRAALFAILPISLSNLQAQPTFHADILPIFEKHCQECHRTGEVAPMPLLTYQQARPWAKAIKSAVLTHKMPPWFADPHFGRFSNDDSLSAKEISLIASWVDSGAPEGKPVEGVKPRQFSDGWMMSRPDQVFEIPHAVQVPATGVVDYMYFSVPTNFTQDRWVESIEVRPTNRSVVHHAIVYVLGADGWAGGQYLAGYAPGAVPQAWRPGQARLIKAGSILIFQMHYTTNGKPGADQTKLGIVFAKHPPDQQVVALNATARALEIPPGAPDYIVEASRTLPQTAYLVGMRAHMHLRGKSFEFRALYPDGRSEVLLRIPKYDFNWQPYYYLETPIKLPRGTRIECTAHFDNSANNEFNPNPRAAVHWGEQSWDEMMIGWFDVAVPAQSDLGLSHRLLTRVE